MRDSIVEKLRDTLSEEIDNECKVVYLLAESRKLLESYPPDPIPFALKLYCHWALHVDLDNPSTTLPFLKRVDEFVASVFGGNNMLLEHRMFREFVFLDTFRDQFRQFLKTYDLPIGVCEKDSRWHEFLKNYAGIIEDGSLSCKANAHRLDLISEVVFKKGRQRAPRNHIPFDLSWEILLLDGKTMTVNVNAANFSDGNQMIFHGIELH